MPRSPAFMRALITCALAAALAARPLTGGETSGNSKNPQAVRDVLSGKRTTANAAWWGFDQQDATEALQAAIHSGAKTVIVPNMEQDWNVRPIKLAGDQELILESGVVITAKRGEYRGGGDSVLTAQDIRNLTIRGDGATVRMQKEDYIVGIVLKDYGWNRWFGQYEKAEWRMALAIRGSTNVKVYGLTLRDSGGDGIYVDGTGRQRYSKDIHIKDVVCDNNYRQGISVISAVGLLVENSVFKNTWGTPPSAGVDIEPDTADQSLKNIVFRNCRFEDNYGDGIEVFLSHLTDQSAEVSILFEDCHVTSSRGTGIRVTKVADNGPSGRIEFRHCVVEGTVGYGIKVQDKSAKRARVRFVDCAVKDAARDRGFADSWTPVFLYLARPERVKQFGGIEFLDCVVEDNHNRAAVSVRSPSAIHDVTGTIRVKNPHGLKANLGERHDSATLIVRQSGGSERP